MSKLAWNDINWTLVQDRISRQQRRVYRASIEGNKAKIHAIQRRIIASLDAKLLAVKKVTTDNIGLNMHGLKEILDENKIRLAYRLKIDGKATIIKRAAILKTGKSTMLPLKFLTIEDRAKQMLVKIALEPEWEAIFEDNSYGFRPERSYYDAVTKLFISLREKSRYVLKIDIKNCYDNIDHDKLVIKLDTFDIIKNQIKAWLKVNIMVDYLNRFDEVFQSMEGRRESDIISPLLANIALHGLEDHIKEWYSTTWYPITERNCQISKLVRITDIGFSRYSDDFVIIAPEQKDIEAIKNQIEIWLYKEVGLELSKAKTMIINSTKGFEFLGFQIINIKKKANEKYKVKIHPSRESIALIIKRIRQLIQENKSVSSYSLINLLSSRIIGWANYFRYSECIDDFSKLDHIIFSQIRAWVFRRKSKGLSSRTKLKDKYFSDENKYIFKGKTYQNKWILTGKSISIDGKIEENFLPKMVWVGSEKYVKIKEKASLYDDNNIYWLERTEKYSGFNDRISKLIKIEK